MPFAGKAKTKLVDGVRVNTRDNSVASPSTYGQGQNAKIKGLTVGDVYSPERQYEDVSAAANLEKLKKKNAWEHSYARKEGKTYTPTVLTDENIRTGATEAETGSVNSDRISSVANDCVSFKENQRNIWSSFQ